MSNKNPFEILRRMNEMDDENKTRLLPVSTAFIEGKKDPRGALITMGVEEGMLLDLLNETRIPMLCMVDKHTYFELMNEKEAENEQ